MIIELKGLSGVGKTTMANMLSKKYKLPIISIDEERRKTRDEITAWINVFSKANKNRKRKGYILDTSGCNGREQFMKYMHRCIVKIFLTASLTTLQTRISNRKSKKKNKNFEYIGFQDRNEFNKIIKKSLDIKIKNRDFYSVVIKTDKLNKEQTFNKIEDFIQRKKPYFFGDNK